MIELKHIQYESIPKEEIKSRLSGWLKEKRPHIVRIIQRKNDFLILYDHQGAGTTHVEIFTDSGQDSINQLNEWLKKEQPCITAEARIGDNIVLFYYKFPLESTENYKVPDNLKNLPHSGD